MAIRAVISGERRRTAVEGWCSIEDLTRWAFSHAPVVMANEAHSGQTRCIRTREIGIRMIQAAHQAGVRRLAMEALPGPANGSLEPIRAIPPGAIGYLAQPEMRRLITTALDLGWSLYGHEAFIDPGKDPAELVSIEFTNWREREQARNLCQILATAPEDLLLVWCGNSHASKTADSELILMGHHFAAMSGIEHFVIDQTVTVDFTGDGPNPWVRELLATLGETLAGFGGTAGILRDQSPSPLNCWPGVDALVISTQNTLT
jgi:hypothetical protein